VHPEPAARRGLRIHLAARPPVDLELVIPAYNEEKRIGRTIRRASAYLGHQAYRSAIVLVDNGSVDRTVDVAAALATTSQVPVHVINCGRRGKGAAVRAGVLSSSARIVGYSDADLATPIETLDRMYPLLERGHPIVIASRKEPGARYVVPLPLARRLGSAAFELAAGLVVDGIPDTQCGFKFFQGAVAKELFDGLTIEDFAFDVEVLALAQRKQCPVTSVPVAWTDHEGSTFRRVPDGLAAMAAIARTWWHNRWPSRRDVS
jgi:glycosyltransferase involved in cell wall biosynthesis